jgi:hypothetical protein
MLEQLLAALLFLFGFQTGGSIRGESTSSAVSSTSATTTTTSAKPFIPNNIVSLQAKFLEKQATAVSSWEAKRASFSASLKTIKDEKKKTLLETIQNRLTEINKNQTELLMRKLKRLNIGVEEMQKLAQAYEKESGKDLSAVTTSLSTANQAIADTISTVTVQAGKTYVISITSETNAKNDVGKVRSQLSSDLKKVRDAVANARKKVGEALKALKNATGKPVTIFIPIETTGNSQTPTVTPTP